MDFYCDHSTPEVVELSRKLRLDASSDVEYAQLSYRWVRDNIRYNIQTNWSVPVSTTLKRGHGDCGTKSSLLVALLRAGGLEADFGVELINTREWFAFVPECVSGKCKSKSIHFTANVKLNGHWYRLDITPDKALGLGLSGAFGQGFLMDFDGKSDALPVVGDEEEEPAFEKLQSIEKYMKKRSRVPASVRECFNFSMALIRRFGRTCTTALQLAQMSEGYIRKHHAAILQDAVNFISQKKINHRDLIAPSHPVSTWSRM